MVLIRILTAIWELIVVIVLGTYYYGEAIVVGLTPSFLKSRKSLSGKVVIITGGAGGVGQELVLALAKIEARVVVWDINNKAMQLLHERCSKRGYKIYSYLVDVTDRGSVYKTAEMVKNQVGAVDVIINNAAIAAGYTLLDIPDELIEKTFQINIISQYWMAKAFLGDMIKRRQGHIVSVGSLTGMLGTYKCTDYSATKFGLTGLHESLLTELKAHGHDNIHMTLVCPYFINTGMFDGCKPQRMPMLEPKDVAKEIIRAIQHDEVFVTIPGFMRFLLPVKHYLPTKLNWFLTQRIFRGPEIMMGMKSIEIEKNNNCIQDVVAA